MPNTHNPPMVTAGAVVAAFLEQCGVKTAFGVISIHKTILTDRDLFSVPPGVYREEINIGDEDALMCVMLGAKKPLTPTYPEDHPLASIQRKKP